MTTYRIICTNQLPVNEPTLHAHIVAVGTGTDPDEPPDRKWTLEEAIAAIDGGDDFYVEVDGKRVDVEVVDCPSCDHRILRTEADDSTANNLDSLPICGSSGSASATKPRASQINPTPQLPRGRQVGQV